MLSSEEFKEWGKSVVLFAHITTKIPGKKYDNMLGEKGGGGWPHIVSLDSAGDVTAKAGGRSVDGFKTMIDSGAKYAATAKKAEKTQDDKVFLFNHEIDLGKLKLEEAKKRLADLGKLSDEQKKSIDGKMLELEIPSVLPKTRGDAAGELVAGKKFAEWFKAGRMPTGGRYFQAYYILMMRYAESEKDADLFEGALDKMREKFGANPGAKKFFDQNAEKLEALKKAASEDDADDEEEEDDDGGM